MARPSLRETLIESGVDTLHRRGYGGSGVREITGSAGVPQGSFTNHFESKEAFVVAVLDRYVERTEAIMDATLHDLKRPPLDRLCSYFEEITALLAATGWRYGCMISNLSLEAAEHSEPIRMRLAQVFAGFTERFAETVRAAQGVGALRSDVTPDDLADTILSAWNGAMLRMKAERSPAPLYRFRRVFLETLITRP